MRCGGNGGSPRYGFGHENPQACKVTCNSVMSCVGFTWHKGVTTQHGEIWQGGCTYVCNSVTTTSGSAHGICSNRLSNSGFGSRVTVASNKYCTDNAVSGANQKCYSKPCFRDSIASKDCSWYCPGGGGKERHGSLGQEGCSKYKTKATCQASASLTNPQCAWVISPSNIHSATYGHRCTDLHDKPIRIIDALSYTGPLAPLSLCKTRKEKKNCPLDRLCSGGTIGDRLEFTTTKVRITEITITGAGKLATIQRELLRGSKKPKFEAVNKVDIVGFGNDIDGRWYIKETPTGFLSEVKLDRKTTISSPTLGTRACPPNGPGCAMQLVNDRGRVPMCTDGSFNSARSHRYMRESEQTITLNSPSQCLIVNPQDWHTMQNKSRGTVLLVLASHHYNQEDYVDEPYH